MTDDTNDLEQEVADLRQRVEALEEQISDSGVSGATIDSYDRYDEYVLNTVEDVASAHPKEIMRAYGEAGVVNKKKKKQRSKRLKRLESE